MAHPDLRSRKPAHRSCTVPCEGAAGRCAGAAGGRAARLRRARRRIRRRAAGRAAHPDRRRRQQPHAAGRQPGRPRAAGAGRPAPRRPGPAAAWAPTSCSPRWARAVWGSSIAPSVLTAYARGRAVKLMLPGPDHAAALARFQSERQIWRRWTTPTWRLLDAGMSDESVPCFMMELIDGGPRRRLLHAGGRATPEAARAPRRRGRPDPRRHLVRPHRPAPQAR